jgi:site-specific DNA recombinase
VLSQVGEGWTALPQAYDDGGYSGGSMDRPGLKRLLIDIRAGRIDVVVATRSIASAARSPTSPAS